MSWSDVEPLSRPLYEELKSITRSLHLKQAKLSCVRQKLTSHKIATRNGKTNAKVLWFAPTKPINQNNMYGNVSFTLDWSTALEQFGSNLYYIDQKETPDIIYSRVLMTDKCHSSLTRVSTYDSRMPLCIIGGKYHVATAFNGVTHVVEIGIEADAKRGKHIYAKCKIQANDHSSANKRLHTEAPYYTCICHRFNYFNKVCPSPYSALETRILLSKQFPRMLRDSPSWKHAQLVTESYFMEEDEADYENGEYIANYDDHEDVTRQISRLKTVAICDDSDDGEDISYHGAYRTGSYFVPGGHGRGQTRDDSFDDDNCGDARASRFRQPATRLVQDEGLSTGSKVALVVGGLALFAGLAAAFAGGSEPEDKKKKTGGS